jgi:hypothetical protein
MVATLDTGRRWRTQFWKGTTHGSYQQSLVEIGKSSPLKLLSQSQPNFAEMILGWSSSKLCPAFQNTDQDGRHSRT